MDSRAEAYSDKCKENLEVSDWAQGEGHCNAAASRYYYALRQAALAYFERIEERPPESVWKGGRKVPNKKGDWPHGYLIKTVDRRLSKTLEAGAWLRRARDLREKADYKTEGVEPHELPELRRHTDELLRALGYEMDNEREG
jgi:hypothetical protein